MAGRLFVPVSGLVLAAALSASGCKRSTAANYTTDIRIDGASETDDPRSFGTQMCVTRDGVVYVLWMDSRNEPGDDSQVDLWMNRSDDLGKEGSWLPAPVQVNHGEGRVSSPDMYCNEGGVYVVWEDDRDGDLDYHQIYFNRSVDKGETFLEEDILLDVNDPEGLAQSLEPQIAGSNDELFVVWSDTIFGAADIFVTSSLDGGLSWGSPLRVDSDYPGEAYSAHPQIAVSFTGQDVWVVWEDTRDGASDIYLARSKTGGTTFEREERLDEGDDDGASGSFNPVLCTDHGENVYVVWHDARGGEGSDIYMNFSGNKGASWQGLATRLDSDAEGFGDSVYPACVAENATLHVAWQDKRGDDLAYDIYYREVKEGIPGDEEIRVDAGTPAGYSHSVDPLIAFHDSQLIVGWRDGRGQVVAGTQNNFHDLYYNYKNATTPFSAEDDYRVDSWPDGRSFKEDVNLALLGGTLFAAWTDGRGGTPDIYFTTLPIGEASDPPTIEELGQAQ